MSREREQRRGAGGDGRPISEKPPKPGGYERHRPIGADESDLIPSSILILGERLEEDVLFGAPLLHALAERFPNCRLGWATTSEPAKLLAGHASGVEVLTLPTGFDRSVRLRWAAKRRLRAWAPSVTIDLTATRASSYLAAGTGARRRIAQSAAPELPWRVRRRVTTPVEALADHPVRRRLRLLEPLGVKHAAARFDLPETFETHRIVERALIERNHRRPYMAVALGGRDPLGIWRCDRAAAVVRYIGRERGVNTLLLATNDDEFDAALRVERASRGHASAVLARSIEETVGYIRRARLLVAPDSWMPHAAAAAAVPCIVLDGPYVPTRFWPFGVPHKIVRSPLGDTHSDGRPFSRETATRCFDEIAYGQVCHACETLLQETAHRTPMPTAKPKPLRRTA